jgi:cytidine deaminase
MKQFNFSAKITVCSYNELDILEKNLVEVAKEASQKAYAPYSRFQVGAAVLLANNEIVAGNNQENAAFPSGLCAERTAVFYANAHYPGEAVKTIAIAAFDKNDYTETPVTPCGACRQVILETEKRYNHPVRMILYGKKEVYIIEKISDLLPLAFGYNQE